MKTTRFNLIRTLLVFTCALVAGYCQEKPLDKGNARGDDGGADSHKEQASKTRRAVGDGAPASWGALSEGFQLSLTFEKDTFTNGEPIFARITLRNSTSRALMYFVSARPTDMTVNLTRGNERLLRKDLRPKPGASLEERLKYVYAGSTGYPKLAPGKDKQFTMELNKMYDLTPGDYLAVAEREILKLSGEDVRAVVSSGKSKFRIVDSAAPNSASPNGRRENP